MSDDIRKEFDVRVVDFHLRRRSVTHDEFDKFLSELPDDAAEGEDTVTKFEPSSNRGADEA